VFVPFAERVLPLEPRRYFETEDPDPDKCARAAAEYISQLKARGFNAVPLTVAAAQSGVSVRDDRHDAARRPVCRHNWRRGAMYGGIGIALSIAYWVILQVCSAAKAACSRPCWRRGRRT
jgi:hypothetical protein